ncbi:hypothetical protein MMC12_004459 [Toensbergia leucococca]|nr:hypothetical protein [Toensbergia leucococca]
MATASSIAPLISMMNAPTDAETLAMFKAPDEMSAEIDKFINNHHLARSLRENADFIESRPHLKFPEAMRSHNLTAGTLSGPGKIAVPPLVFSEKKGKSLVSISYMGTDLCGHAGVLHGGLLATLLDEGMARCCFAALPHKIGLTASLTVNYRKPAPAGSFLCLRAKTVKVEGRKAWVEGRIETLVGEGKQPVVLVEASGLFVEPKEAVVR